MTIFINITIARWKNSPESSKLNVDTPQTMLKPGVISPKLQIIHSEYLKYPSVDVLETQKTTVTIVQHSKDRTDKSGYGRDGQLFGMV